MLKVMTLNINYYGTKHGPWSVRRKLIQQVIQAARPDIIALQAVRQDPAVQHSIDQAAQLAELLPEYVYRIFQEAAHTPDGGSEGSAFLSRIKILESHSLELSLRPGLEDNNPRVVLHARFDLPGSPFHIFNAHFSWVFQQALDNADEALAYTHSLAGRAMLVGDLNTIPTDEPMKRFGAAGWTDAWATLRPDQEGFTFVESGRLAKRIDYAWVNALLEPELQSIDIVADNQTAEGARPSDHAGLLITLSTNT